MFQRKIPVIFVLFSMWVLMFLTACGQNQEIRGADSATEMLTIIEEVTEETVEETVEKATEETTEEIATTDYMKEMFGKNCISEQTFEVDLSEYGGEVHFVPFAPSGEKQELYMQIIQDGKVLEELETYIPSALTGEKFSSLDAVSFYDVNYDGGTDIVLIETYGSTSFVAVYYGFPDDAEEYERHFSLQEELSETISEKVEQLTISEIRNFLKDGRTNGKFDSYQEAYEAVSRLSTLESSAEIEYNLVYFDGDDVPELVTGLCGYYTSLYTYRDGTVYTLMDRWPYGAMGNHGYEYVPGKNNLRNYNTDFAGAILYTTYWAISKQHSMDIDVQIVTYNFDDANGNGQPDENEECDYSVSYINGVEVSAEECDSYNVGEYEELEVGMSLEELRSKLSDK